VKIGHIFLSTASDDSILEFASLVEALDRLAIEQHVLVASVPLVRRLQSCPYVTVGPVVKTPVMAYCLMPNIDIVHIHDSKSGQAGLLLTLTRSIPFVMTTPETGTDSRNPLKRSVFHRAQEFIPPSDAEPQKLIEIYRRTVDGWSKFPQDADCG
jgi:hypothetical protein